MKIIVNNLALNYLDIGTGSVVVIMHGWGTNIASMRSIIDPLSSSYRVLAVDLPGFGQSEIPKEPWHVKDYAQQIADFLKKVGIEDPYALVGHSFGGRVAIKAVGENMLSPEKIILVGAAGINHSASLHNQLFRILAKIGRLVFTLPFIRKFASPVRAKLYQSAGSTDYINAGPMQKIFSNTISEDLSLQAATITQPTLLIWGENDEESPIADARRFKDLIAHSALHIIPSAGHFVHSDEPAIVNRLIDEFLK